MVKLSKVYFKSLFLQKLTLGLFLLLLGAGVEVDFSFPLLFRANPS